MLRKFLTASVLIGGLMVSAGVTTPAAAAPIDPTAPSHVVKDDNVQTLKDMFNGINDFRKSKGLAPVKISASITEVSQGWSDELASTDKFYHNPSYASDPHIIPKSWSSAGEIIAARWDRNGAGLVSQWVNSPGHNAIMSTASHNRVGLGITYTNGTNTPRYAMYGVVNFFTYHPTVKEISFDTVEAYVAWLENPTPTPSPSPSPTPTPTPTPTQPPVTPTPTPTPTQPPVTPSPTPTQPPVTPTQPPVTPTPSPSPTPTPKPNPSIKTAGDIVASDKTGSLYNYGKAPFTKTKIGSGFVNVKELHVTDWNIDGTQDLLVRWSNKTDVTLFTGKITGGFNKGKTVTNVSNAVTETHVVKWKKTDKRPSFVTKDTRGDLWLYSNPNGSTMPTRTKIGTGWQKFNKIVFLDWKVNGAVDVIARDSSGAFSLYRTDGNGKWLKEARPVVTSKSWSAYQQVEYVKDYAGKNSHGVLTADKNGRFVYTPLNSKGWGTSVLLATRGWQAMIVAGH